MTEWKNGVPPAPENGEEKPGTVGPKPVVKLGRDMGREITEKARQIAEERSAAVIERRRIQEKKHREIVANVILNKNADKPPRTMQELSRMFDEGLSYLTISGLVISSAEEALHTLQKDLRDMSLAGHVITEEELEALPRRLAAVVKLLYRREKPL
jgi:hypothetical protein